MERYHTAARVTGTDEMSREKKEPARRHGRRALPANIAAFFKNLNWKAAEARL